LPEDPGSLPDRLTRTSPGNDWRGVATISNDGAITRIGPLHFGQSSGSDSQTLRMSRAQAALARVASSLAYSTLVQADVLLALGSGRGASAMISVLLDDGPVLILCLSTLTLTLR
jgi:hypothetical protein